MRAVFSSMIRSTSFEKLFSFCFFFFSYCSLSFSKFEISARINPSRFILFFIAMLSLWSNDSVLNQAGLYFFE